MGRSYTVQVVSIAAVPERDQGTGRGWGGILDAKREEMPDARSLDASIGRWGKSTDEHRREPQVVMRAQWVNRG